LADFFIHDELLRHNFHLFSRISVPLLHVLSLHALVLYKDSPVWRVWANICGVQTGDNNTPVPSYHSYEIIPSLLSDPCALMLKFILMSPLQLDQGEF
jgi:E3 ubiquitin-protein ligase UBR3